ncbi:MAG: TonB-dependent receptor, partial [Proteobacteria bacterium]
SSVRPNQNLKPEKIYHREIGVFTTLFGVEWGAAAYEDRTDQKIVFVPIQANSSKALNVAKTEISGYDGSITWQGESTGLTFKISELDALDKSKNKARTLPGIPNRITVMEWRQQWAKPFSSYVTSRYRSEIYRDLANSIKLPGSVIYDLNLDCKYRRFELGFAPRNLANTTDVEIASGASKGRTSFSDFAGAPLPGRQWILSLVYTTED